MLWYPGYPGSKSLGLKSAELALDCYIEPPNHIATNHSIWLAMVSFILSVYSSASEVLSSKWYVMPLNLRLSQTDLFTSQSSIRWSIDLQGQSLKICMRY